MSEGKVKMFIKVDGNWTDLRAAGVLEVDFHRIDPRSSENRGRRAFEDNMAQVEEDAMAALQRAQQEG